MTMSNEKCKNCKSRLILASGYVAGVEADEEPYKADVPENIETELAEDTEYGVSLHICPRCGYIDEIWPDGEKL